MSLQSRPIPPIPNLTAKVARRALRNGNVYMQMRDGLGGKLPYHKNGRINGKNNSLKINDNLYRFSYTGLGFQLICAKPFNKPSTKAAVFPVCIA